MSAKEKLEKVYNQYISVIKIYRSAKNRTQRDKSFAIEIVSPKKSKKIQHEANIIDDYFDSLYSEITELYIFDIITTFERILFEKIDNTSGVIKSIVTDEYHRRYSKKDKPAPLYHSAVSFIKDKEDIHNLSGIRKVLEKQMPRELFDDLKELIEHRNWLSHGKRQNIGKESLFKIDEIYETLIKIIDIVQ